MGTPLYRRVRQYQIRAQNVEWLPDPGSVESVWHYPWSEPVRFRISKGLAIALGASGLFAPIFQESIITEEIEARWHYPWSEPVRFNPLFKKGLSPPYQQVIAVPVRYLPTADVISVVMSAVDPPVTDTGNADIWVYDEVPVDLTDLKVSITEIPSDGIGASSSLREEEP